MFRSLSSSVNLIVRRISLLNHYRSIADNVSSQKKSASSSTDSNEWLWEYLRHRQSYQSLNDQQKRQVIILE